MICVWHVLLVQYTSTLLVPRSFLFSCFCADDVFALDVSQVLRSSR